MIFNGFLSSDELQFFAAENELNHFVVHPFVISFSFCVFTLLPLEPLSPLLFYLLSFGHCSAFLRKRRVAMVTVANDGSSGGGGIMWLRAKGEIRKAAPSCQTAKFCCAHTHKKFYTLSIHHQVCIYYSSPPTPLLYKNFIVIFECVPVGSRKILIAEKNYIYTKNTDFSCLKVN